MVCKLCIFGAQYEPVKELYLLKISLVFILIESSITTLSYFFIFFLWSVNNTNMVYILCITSRKCQDTQKLFGIYLVLTYIQRLSRLSFYLFLLVSKLYESSQ